MPTEKKRFVFKHFNKIVAFLLTSALTLSSFNASAGIMPLVSKRHWGAQIFIANQIKGIGLVDSYQEDDKDVSYVYDNAVAAIACMLMNNYGLAVEILNTLTREVQNTEEGVPFEFYYYSDFTGNGGWVAYCGNSAWLLQTLNIYQKLKSTKQYYFAQKKLADFLLTLQDPGDGGLRGSPFDYWKSVEHNIIAYVALRNFGKLNNHSKYITQAEKIREFLTSPAVWNGERFNRGPYDINKVVDVQALGVLLLGSEYSSALTWAEDNLRATRPYNSETVTGFDFDSNLDTVWLEGTIQMSLAFYQIGDYEKANYYFSEVCKTVQSDGSILLATNRGTAAEYWILQPWRAIAPTSWFIFYYFKFNPLILF